MRLLRTPGYDDPAFPDASAISFARTFCPRWASGVLATQLGDRHGDYPAVRMHRAGATPTTRRKSTGTLAYAFDGGFIETTTAYNALGQVTQVAKPFHLATVADNRSPSYTQTSYDNFNRVFSVTDPLGFIDACEVDDHHHDLQRLHDPDRPTGERPDRDATRDEERHRQGLHGDHADRDRAGEDFVRLRRRRKPDEHDRSRETTSSSGTTRAGERSRRSIPTWEAGPTSDGFGDLIGQTDAKSARRHDLRSTRPDGDEDRRPGTAQWVYDSAPGAGKGKLAAMVSAPDSHLAGPCTIPLVSATGGNRAGKSFRYTALGDVQEMDECADGAAFATTYEYDALGRQSLIRYPAVNTSQLAVGYHYTSLGYLQYLTDESSDYSVLWQAKAMNALGQVTDEQMRNGVETVSNRNPLTGWLLGSTATAHADHDNLIQNWSYGFDEIGNLLTRNRADAVNRRALVRDLHLRPDESPDYLARDHLRRIQPPGSVRLRPPGWAI